MSLHIDLKYIRLLSPRLLCFKQISQDAFRFRCPICGDSKKKKLLARGNVTAYKGHLSYTCFNCRTPIGFGGLLKQVDPQLHKEWNLERFRKDAIGDEPIFKAEPKGEILTDSVLDNLIRITDLPDDHPVLSYVNRRMIPKDKWERIYYSKKFKAWVNSIIPDKFNELSGDYPRLVFPYFNRHGRVFAVNARAFGKEEPKYIIVKFDPSVETVYGLDTVNWSRHILVVEGQIDSLFLPNCLAVSGSSFDNLTIRGIKTNCTLVFDNEPRNKQTAKIISDCIDAGYTVCLLPELFTYKDINAAVQGGISIQSILNTIKENTFKNLQAKLRFTQWRK